MEFKTLEFSREAMAPGLPEKRIREALACPVCFQTTGSALEGVAGSTSEGAAGSRAVQCSNGHAFCEPCLKASLFTQEQQDRPTTCPTCRVAVDPNALIRCLVAEQLAADVECSCSGAELGCDWQGKGRGFESHQATCLYVKLREERSARVEADARIDKLQLALDAAVVAIGLCKEAASQQQQRERRKIRLAEERREWSKAPLPGFHMLWESPMWDYLHAPGRDYQLVCGMPGPVGTEWEGGVFPVTMRFPPEYPVNPTP